MRKLKILLISSHFPYPNAGSGGANRVFNIVSSLSEKYDLSIISYLGPGEENYVSEIRRFCARVETVPAEVRNFSFPKTLAGKAIHLFYPCIPDDAIGYKTIQFSEKLRRLVADENYDAFCVEFPQMCVYLDDLPKKAFKIYDSHEVRSVNLYRLFKHTANPIWKTYYLSQFFKMKMYERYICKNFNIVVALTEKDSAYFRKIAGETLVICVPTGVKLKNYIFAKRREPGGKTIIFVGNMLNYPNVDAVLYFCRNILPLIRKKEPEIKFYIIGSKPPREIEELSYNKSIIITGYVENLKPFFENGNVFIAPIRLGGGIKGKIIEAMASGIPVVATSEANEGISAEPDKEILIADKPQDFADKVISLLNDGGLSMRIAHNARSFVERNYNWENNILVLMKAIDNELLSKIQHL